MKASSSNNLTLCFAAVLIRRCIVSALQSTPEGFCGFASRSASQSSSNTTRGSKGVRDAKSPGGIGLDGLGERLELMGGHLHIASKAGCTLLVAEIPVAT